MFLKNQEIYCKIGNVLLINEKFVSLKFNVSKNFFICFKVYNLLVKNTSVIYVSISKIVHT